jgi:chaperonin GroES
MHPLVQLQPLGDRVVIEIDSPITQSGGGILLPESTDKKSQTGVVISAGPGRAMDNGSYSPMPVKVGDRVMFTKWAGVGMETFLAKDENLVLMRVDEILGIMPAQ